MASGFVLSLVIAATSFATAPFLLDQLGVDRFGAFRAALGWLGLLGLLEFGVGGALQALFARALGSGERAEIGASVRAGVRAYLLLAGLMGVAAIGLSVVLPQLIRIPLPLVGELEVGCGLYILTFALLPLSAFRPLAEAGQRGYVVNLLLAAQTLTAAFAALACAWAGWGMAGQFAALLAGSLVFHLGLAFDGLRRYHAVLTPTSDAPRSGGALWALSWPSFLFNLSGRIGLASDELVIAGLLGPAAVTSFFLTQRVITVVGSQIFAIGAATWAGLVDLHFRGEHAVFVRRLAQLSRLTAVLGAGLLVPVAVRNRDLITLWVGPDRYAGALITGLAVVNTWGQALVALWLWPLSGAGLVRKTLPAVASSAVVNLMVSLGATALVGLPGPLIGTTTTLVGLNWWWSLLLLRRHFEVPPSSLLMAAAGPALLAILYAIALVVCADLVPALDASWPRWVRLLAIGGWLATATLGYLALAFLLVLPAADWTEWADRLRRRPTQSPPIPSGS